MTAAPFDGVRRTARISDCGAFRYHLGRYWARGDGVLLFVMLNPSVGSDLIDDPTIRRCMRFAADGGFAGLEIVNLFAFCATDPRDLAARGYQVGPLNDDAIADAASYAREICVAWGVAPAAEARVQQVGPMLRGRDRTLQCLRITRSGWPGHPLYLPASCRLHPFTAEAIDEARAGGAR